MPSYTTIYTALSIQSSSENFGLDRWNRWRSTKKEDDHQNCKGSQTLHSSHHSHNQIRDIHYEHLLNSDPERKKP